MAVDRSAVREGTRWGFRGQIVVVLEVSPYAHVVFAPQGQDAQVTSLWKFATGAVEPAALEQPMAAAEYRELLTELTKISREVPALQNEGVLLCLLRDTVLHLLHRLGEPVAPRADHCGCGSCTVEAPHASDCAVHNEPAYPAGPCDCEVTVADAEPLKDCAIEIPVDEPLAYDKPRGMKRKGGW